MLDSLLDHLARQRGIGDAYYTYRGELRAFSSVTKTAILAAMGCRVDDAASIQHEIAELDAERWRSLLPVVAVIRPGRSGVVIAVPADLLDQPVEWSLRLADGHELAGSVRAGDLTEFERTEVDGRWRTRRLLVLPDRVPQGYHSLRVRAADGSDGSCTLIAAPSRCYEPAVLSRGSRLWGVAVQLYTLRSESNWGIGDFADLEAVVRRCAPHGAAFIGLNPLHARRRIPGTSVPTARRPVTS
jgi:hypothetical protein